MMLKRKLVPMRTETIYCDACKKQIKPPTISVCATIDGDVDALKPNPLDLCHECWGELVAFLNRWGTQKKRKPAPGEAGYVHPLAKQ